MLRRLAIGLFVTIAASIGWASLASAHAQLDSSDPAPGSVLADSPTAVSLHFAEDVEIPAGAIRVLDSNGEAIPVGVAEHPSGDGATVTAGLPQLSHGGYVAAWRAISADGHPVEGAFTFRVGKESNEASQGVVKRALASGRASRSVGVVFAIVRATSFAALILLIGTGWFLIAARLTTAESSPWRLVRWGWLGLVVTTVATVGLQAAEVVAGTLRDSVRFSLWGDVLHSSVGSALILRMGALAGGAVLLAIRPWLGSNRIWVSGAVVDAGAVALSFALVGHARTGSLSGLGVAANTIHVLAFSVWIGGLVALGSLLRSSCVTDSLVVKFSHRAFAAVVVVVASGVTLSLRIVNNVHDLYSSHYGQTLLVKTSLVALIVAVASTSRRLVHGHLSINTIVPRVSRASVDNGTDDLRGAMQANDLDRSKLRTRVLAEIVLAVGVLVAASVLVDAAPPRTVANRPISTSIVKADLTLQIVLDPARRGINELHTYIQSPNGVLKPVLDVIVKLSNANLQVGAISVPMSPAGPNHFASFAFEIPVAGSWVLEVDVRTDEFTEVPFILHVDIR